MIRTITTTVLTAAAVGAVALAGTGTASAAPAKCEAAARNGVQAVLDSQVCSGRLDQGVGGSAELGEQPPAHEGPNDRVVYDPDHNLDGGYRLGGEDGHFVVVPVEH
jgi:hypothetical protein